MYILLFILLALEYFLMATNKVGHTMTLFCILSPQGTSFESMQSLLIGTIVCILSWANCDIWKFCRYPFQSNNLMMFTDFVTLNIAHLALQTADACAKTDQQASCASSFMTCPLLCIPSTLDS